MANVVKLIGKIRPVKDGYQEKEFSKGNTQKRLKFMMICGDNTQFLDISAWVNKDNNPILTFSKGDANHKGEKISIPWDKRFDETELDKVANFKKFVIDTEVYGARQEIEKSGDESALIASKKKRHDYIAQIDFVEALAKLVASDKIKDMYFEAICNVEYSYYEAKDTFYQSIVPQKIYRMPDDVEPASEGTFDIYYTSDAVDSESEDETGKSIVSAYIQYYDTRVKKNTFCPKVFVMHKDTPKTKGFKTIFGKAEDGKVYKLGVVTELINGSPRVEINEDMLSDEQKELLDLGMLTLEDIRKEMNGYVRGEKVVETSLKGLARGYSKGAEDTIYGVSDLTTKPIIKVEKEEVVDLFADDDDDII